MPTEEKYEPIKSIGRVDHQSEFLSQPEHFSEEYNYEETYDYDDPYNYENRQFQEMDNLAPSSNLTVIQDTQQQTSQSDDKDLIIPVGRRDFSPAKSDQYRQQEEDSYEARAQKYRELNDLKEELPHLRRVILSSRDDESSGRKDEEESHRRTVILSKPREPEKKPALTEKEKQILMRDMHERQKRLKALEKELEHLRMQQDDLVRKRQKSKMGGNSDKILLENTKLQEEIAKQITKLRKAAEENAKKLTSDAFEEHTKEERRAKRKKDEVCVHYLFLA